MNKTIRNFQISLAVIVVSGVALSLLDLAAGGSSSSLSIFLPIFLGILAGCALQAMSENRREVRIDDATRQSSLNAVPPAGPGQLPSLQRAVSGFRSEPVK
ncbi:MAG TPA: hypothetical protein VKH40_02955 [Alloacidobacterium sp.]|nr:hypothetical protein [Alloacidobacterium sp.]